MTDTTPQFAGLGFAVGSVRGTRSFRITESGFLRGYVYNTTWLPGVNIASCMRRGYGGCGYTPDAGGQHRHSSLCWSAEPCGPRSPGSSCKCGFYGYYDGSLDYAAHNTVSGVVEGFGKVTIGTRGFRCEKARVIALYIPEQLPESVPEPILTHFVVPSAAGDVKVAAVRPAWLTQQMAESVIERYAVPTYSHLPSMLSDFPPDPPRVKEV